MKHFILSVMTAGLAFMLSSVQAQSTSTPNHSPKNKTIQNEKSVTVVKEFFSAFSNGNLEGIINSFHEDAVIYAVRNGQRLTGEIYGTYKGRSGAREFINNLGSTFDTRAFQVDRIAGDGELAFATGSFLHIVKSTGREYSSQWALACVIKDNKIIEYRFYEDSASFLVASKKNN